MKLGPVAVYLWIVIKWADGLLQLENDENLVSDEGSGEADELKLKTKAPDTFRDLICFQCSGSECASKHYREPLRHLVTSCQACYKEWDEGVSYSTRKCFYPSDLKEHTYSNETTESVATCGVIQRGSRMSYYCFCYLDYCNHSSHVSVSWRMISSALFLWAACHQYFSVLNQPIYCPALGVRTTFLRPTS